MQWQIEKAEIWSYWKKWQNFHWLANKRYQDSTSFHEWLRNAVLMLQGKLLEQNESVMVDYMCQWSKKRLPNKKCILAMNYSICALTQHSKSLDWSRYMWLYVLFWNIHWTEFANILKIYCCQCQYWTGPHTGIRML